ncbi:MAG TPA: amidohydrolase [Bryobacteraceae bacterium]|nr:amidohydrolase [Bryobacteraceae bacterium]
MIRILLLLAAISASLAAQDADLVLINGKILTVDSAFSTKQALAVRDGKITALGTTAEIRKLTGKKTNTIDLGGRTVIPGLIDSHMHAIRAASFFATETNWAGVPTLAEALQRIRDSAAAKQPGEWVIVGGGWKPEQFREKRAPTQAELAEAAGDHPAYVQLLYASALLNQRGLDALHIRSDADLPAGGKLDRDASGNLTGGVKGGIVALFDRLPRPTVEQQVAGTKKFFRELNRLAMTGVSDPCGNNVTPASYDAINRVWRDRQLTVRVSYTICGFNPPHEFDEYQKYLGLMPMGFGDDMMHFNGIGEQIVWAINNVVKPDAADLERFYQIASWAAKRGYGLTFHCGTDAAVDAILTVFERVDRETPIKDLRWSIAHLNDASPASLRRMKALGMGWTMQDAMYFDGQDTERRVGPEAVRRMPPVETARELGVPVGAGTDAHRVAPYNPFTALQWALDGTTVGGKQLRGPEETPSRANALRAYTMDSAWFSHDDDKRGSLEPGKLADFAVLTKDYATIPVDQIGGLESLMTVVGGRIVYAAGPFAKWQTAP